MYKEWYLKFGDHRTTEQLELEETLTLGGLYSTPLLKAGPAMISSCFNITDCVPSMVKDLIF